MAGTDMSGYCEGSSSSERFNTITSSDKVDNTRNELEHQEQVIVQSGKLLGKYAIIKQQEKGKVQSGQSVPEEVTENETELLN
ncbi:uncharacterized protein LOC105180891 isoform X6 [Harpegnathos saltator]|uniref:uncharacterized protein LOC105180891 isoform X6 n=1 Tax=Harpegnathos saltator TaxID=610380 RepID=UPI000DBED1F1|nr:uncharacterized protein LOC105180891 isoform X6 [Harpegnathos saltator]